MFSLYKKIMLSAVMAGSVWSVSSSARGEDFTLSKPFSNAAVNEKTAAIKPKIQIALLLDTSNSMDGLINQAKSQLWKVVNELATAKQNGRAPEIEVALYQYGTPSLGADNGFIRQVLPFSTDLDKVSEELFALKTNGGDEFCGWAVRTALSQLNWSTRANDLKAIYVCGNEPFTQGNVDFHTPCKDALAKGITVNTIFCGPEAEGIAGKWQEGAQAGGGTFFNINQDRQVAVPKAPQDDQLRKLNADLNGTYIGYGRGAGEGRARQEAQDKAAASTAPAVAAERAMAKSSGQYRNSTWDAVDAVKDGKLDLKEAKKEDLPQEMQEMSVEKRKEYIEKKQVEREEIQQKIKTLSVEREKFVQEELKKTAKPGDKSLDEALIKSVKKQAETNGFEFQGK